jgi:hypothetical protein
MVCPWLEVAVAPGENPSMRLVPYASLAILLQLVGQSGAVEITVYRGQDSQGRVSLEDEPCPAGQAGTSRQMLRPQDPPPRPAASEPAAEVVETEAAAQQPSAYYAPSYPPPPMYQCTDFDGEVRYSEDYGPRTRCVPLPVLGYDVRGSPQAAASCRWVTESCLLLDDASACEQFKRQLRQTRSDALHAFRDRAYLKSEVIRLDRIVAESCR